MDNAHWFWDKPASMQGIQNLRGPFKKSKRVLICLNYGATMPDDLVQSMSFIDDPLPTEDTLAEYVSGAMKATGGKVSDEERKQIAQELRGSSPFMGEQLVYQSLTPQGTIDREQLRGNIKRQIDETPGLSTESGSFTLDDIGGLQAVTTYIRRYNDGPRRPVLYVRIEEIEKAMQGHDTDTSGTSSDILGTLLTEMEDNNWTGMMCYGPSGTGKSLFAKAAANTFGARALRLDPNACKGGIVGQTGEQIRRACAVLKAIGGDRVFFCASMNKIDSLPLELRRRFSAGTWFFDCPDDAGRKEIWDIHCKQLDIEYDGYDAKSLTGSDIRDITQRAYELQLPLKEAATYHVPLCKSAPDVIDKCKQGAHGRYLCANKGGLYYK